MVALIGRPGYLSKKNWVNTQGNRFHRLLVSGNTFLPDQQQQFVEIIMNFKLYHSDFI
ncbi:hypothetical protein BYT27DRAFT_7180314 [Phlegmacium glaucopus]|nr:hypothetical protein BYT27DRAFT_7180314 [Phlegmacium glaucopus]